MASPNQELGIFSSHAGSRASSQTLLFGQVMFLVAVSLAFFAGGAYIGRDLSYGTGIIFELVAIGMLFAQSFVKSLRVGTVAVIWLYGLALLLGIGLGPVLAYYTTTDPAAVWQAGAGTALTVAAMGSYGFATSRDLSRGIRFIFWSLLGVILLSWVVVLTNTTGLSLFLALAIYVLSAALLAINFQYLRRSASADDAVWIATGIFVNVVNIFLALLQIFGNSR
jgi:FtsH-binding integral membrane protein